MSTASDTTTRLPESREFISQRRVSSPATVTEAGESVIRRGVGVGVLAAIAVIHFLDLLDYRTPWGDIGNWLEPLGFASLFVEGAVILLAVAAILRPQFARLRLRSRNASSEVSGI